MALKLFTDIGELLTLKGMADKKGRRPQQDDLSILPNAAMVCDGKKIVWLGNKKRIPKQYRKRGVKRISLKGADVLPAFVECHTHLVFAGNRAEEFELRNQGASYQEISRQGGGILSTVNNTRKATAAELRRLAQKRVDTFVRQGVTSLEIKSGYALDSVSERKMLRVAKSLKGPRVITTYLGPHAVPPEYKGKAADYFNNVVLKDLDDIKKQRLATRADIFVEKGFFDYSIGQKYFEKARDLGFYLTIHADQLSRSQGARLAYEFKAQSADHIIELNESDLIRLARSEVTGVLLPGADLYLKTSYPKARRIIDEGGRVALATDFNPGSCPSQNLSFIGVLARLEMKMTLPETICAYTLNSAYALGLQNQVGSLEAGKLADFIVLNGKWNQLFYGIGENLVQQVWKEGNLLHKN